ncbi:Electron transport complex subunit RsxG [bioreactor metagenome]|uniref:Electron transport complex subunit RsxG n=1 Tax=bioreactor metagenome TaxID=1076179 RepID=A0A645AAL0_9ZZZZ
MLEVYADSISRMADILANEFGANRDEFVDWSSVPLIGSMSPEYPEFEGHEKIGLWTIHQGISDSYLWQLLRKNVTDRAENIDVWFESPGTGLIQDPESKTILGVEVEREGKTLNIRAKNGVVLATGGFENNPSMVENYLGLAEYAPIGGLYNTGDGIRMALDVGADLWHMEVYEGLGDLGANFFEVEPGTRGKVLFFSKFTSGASILVAEDGARYLKEDEVTRHGHISLGGVWVNSRYPKNSYIVFDQAVLDAVVAAGTIAADDTRILSAASVAELAEKTGINADGLAATIKKFNGYAASGNDAQLGRSAASMASFAGDKYYAIKMIPNILNTQGGPRRNENAEVLDRDGNPIPHLYSAGELGGITSFQYQGGGNIAECITFGKIAGTNAAAAKTDTLPAYAARTAVTSTPTYLPGTTTDIAPVTEEPAPETAENEYIGKAEGMGGPVTVKVTMDGDAIAKVEVISHKETDGIGTKPIDSMPEQFVGMKTADEVAAVDKVAGATITSNALKEAVADALSQVK